MAITGLSGAAERPACAAEGDVAGLHFHADDVEADLRMRELILRGDVALLYDRFRLTSPELRLRTSTRGVGVDGQGRVVFCPCPNPPLAVGFSGALIAPPADLLLKQPRLELFGITVLALPWFWLRSPSRIGLLPPIIAWRGADKLLLGAGVHLPWRTEGGWDELDITGAAYSVGGFEITARFRTEHSTARLRFDHVETAPSGVFPGSDDSSGLRLGTMQPGTGPPAPARRGWLAAIDARGSVAEPQGGAVTWDIDAIRGSRARSGTLLLEEAARAYDRGAFDVVSRSSAALVSAGIWGIGARGRLGWSTVPVWGPRVSVGMSGPLATVGAWDLSSQVLVLQQDSQSGMMTQLARLGGGAEFVARPGPVIIRATLRHTMTAAQSPRSQELNAAVAGRLESALPLVRTSSRGEGGRLAHVLEPHAEVMALAARGDDGYYAHTGSLGASHASPGSAGVIGIAAAGVRSTWGEPLGRSATSWDVSGGVVYAHGQSPPVHPTQWNWVGRWRAGWGGHAGWARNFRLAAEGAVVATQSTADQVTVVRAGVGSREIAFVNLGIAGTGASTSPLLARLLGAARAEEPSGGWLASQGWTGLGECGARLLRTIEIGAGVDGDITGRALLAVRGTAAYIHPCRCLRIEGFAAQRMGRSGVDLWLSVDLAPR